MKKLIIQILIIMGIGSSIHTSFAENRKYIFSNDIKVSILDDNLYHIGIDINWAVFDKKQVQYIKIVHSTTNPDIVYKDGNYIWASNNIDTTSVSSNFNNYTPNFQGINYYRACITTLDTIYCSKSNYSYPKENQTNHQKFTLEEITKIKTFLQENKDALNFIASSSYLQGRVGIKTNNMNTLLQEVPSLEAFKDIKYLIELIAQDIKNTKEIEAFVKEYSNKTYTSQEEIKDAGEQVGNWLDLNTRSKEELGLYTLTLGNKEKLNSLKKSLLDQYENFGSTQKTLTLKDTSDKKNTRSVVVSSTTSNNGKNREVSVSDIGIPNLIYTLIVGIILVSSFFIIFSKIKLWLSAGANAEVKENTHQFFKEHTLQILKSENEYIVEYNGIYNKGVQVLKQNKDNITSTIYRYVQSVNKLQVRGKDIYEELSNLDIKVPDLKESGNTIYRLYLGENIRSSIKLQNQNDALVIKTDEQDVPWEIMHDGENFLSLKYPISRKIMTRETIRKNEVVKNKKPKILFIFNPTLDLKGTVDEVKNIIIKLGKKADITLISGEQATSSKILSLLGQPHWDIIHYSGHAYFDKINPDMSGLILRDSVVSATEIKRILNGNPLMFINGCSSGRSDEKNFQETGEDTTGIASSFLIGGAKGVVSTLWPISDSISSEFAGIFYEQFLKNNSIGNALLAAKKEVYIAYPNDITWASFIYYGDVNLTLNS